MAFLTVNGYTVKVADGSASYEPTELGTRERSPLGWLRATRQAIKGEWTLQTTPLIPIDAAAVIGLLSSRGNRWGWDNEDTIAAALYDSKGLGPSAGSVATLHTTKTDATFSATVHKAATVNAGPDLPKYGDACVAVDDNTVNLMTANQRDGTEDGTTTGFSALGGGALASSTAQKWQGSRSLLVTSGAAADGFATDMTAITAEQTYTASVYLLASQAGAQVDVEFRDSTGAGTTVNNVALSTTKWTRVEVTRLMAIASTTAHIRVTADNANDFHADGLQIELKAHATSWFNGTRGEGVLTYVPRELDDLRDLTIMFWTAGPTGYATTTDERTAILITNGTYAAGGPWVQVYRKSGDGNNVKFAIQASGGTLREVAKVSPWNGSFHHIAAVFRRAPPNGTNAIEIYYDGTLATQLTGIVDADMPAFKRVGVNGTGGNDLRVGHQESTEQWSGYIDELVVLPYAATAAQITAWSARQFSDLPKLEIAGDAIARGPNSIEALAEVAKSSIVQNQQSGSWNNASIQVAFAIAEF